MSEPHTSMFTVSTMYVEAVVAFWNTPTSVAHSDNGQIE